jgi:hypothetical protein
MLPSSTKNRRNISLKSRCFVDLPDFQTTIQSVLFSSRRRGGVFVGYSQIHRNPVPATGSGTGTYRKYSPLECRRFAPTLPRTRRQTAPTMPRKIGLSHRVQRKCFASRAPLECRYLAGSQQKVKKTSSDLSQRCLLKAYRVRRAWKILTTT